MEGMPAPADEVLSLPEQNPKREKMKEVSLTKRPTHAIQIGTSGFSYEDWKGVFYPPNMPKAQWFEFYVQRFSCLEINSSYYSFLSPRTVQSLIKRAPASFRFAIKLHKSLTHEVENTEESIRKTKLQNRPFQESGTLAVHLAQFPHSFVPSREAWNYLRHLSQEIFPLCIEFRNIRWQTDETIQRLREWGVSLCVVDQPDLPGLMKFAPLVTHSPAYIRFHGRNAKTWYHHQETWQRYDYLYSEQELSARIEDIKQMSAQAEETLIFFNNHFQAQAITNATQLARLLGLTPN